MTGPAYSIAGFATKMKWSTSAGLFIVVEGKELDRAFYDRLAASSVGVSAAGYEVWPVELLTRNSGIAGSGKTAVLKLYDVLRLKRQLTGSNSNKKQSIVFCVDRDNDHMAHRTRSGKHVIYTETYDVEAYLYRYGASKIALSNAAYLDVKNIDEFLRVHGDWYFELAVRLREWITLCCLAKATGARCRVGFNQTNFVNSTNYGSVDPLEVAVARAEIARQCRCTPQELADVERRLRKRINRAYLDGDWYRLIKGKWVPSYLKHLLRSQFSGQIVLNGIEGRIVTAFLASLDFRMGWADYYRRRFENVLA